MKRIKLLVGNTDILKYESKKAKSSNIYNIIKKFPDSKLTPSEITYLAYNLVQEFLCIKESNEDIVMLITTNNDHLINGFRRAIKRGILSYDQFEICYYDDNKHLHNIYADQRGRLYMKLNDKIINDLPKGFLDEWFKSTIELF